MERRSSPLYRQLCPYTLPVFVFVETPLFTKLVSQYLSDEELSALQAWLLANPDSGDLIPRSGGLRKLRWGRAGQGKRGGVRVIYWLRSRADTIWLLTLYAKNETENISPHQLRRIAKEIEDAEGRA